MIPPLDFGHLCDAVSEGGGGGNGEEILCAKEELIELLLGSRVHLSPWHLDHLQLQLETLEGKSGASSRTGHSSSNSVY
jgi:hypothetical protein